MSLFKQLLVRCPLRLDNPTVSILVAKVGVCLAQEAAAFKAFPSDTLIFEPVAAATEGRREALAREGATLS